MAAEGSDSERVGISSGAGATGMKSRWLCSSTVTSISPQRGFGSECLAWMEHRLGLDGRPWKLVLRIQGECCFVPSPGRVAVR